MVNSNTGQVRLRNSNPQMFAVTANGNRDHLLALEKHQVFTLLDVLCSQLDMLCWKGQQVTSKLPVVAVNPITTFQVETHFALKETLERLALK